MTYKKLIQNLIAIDEKAIKEFKEKNYTDLVEIYENKIKTYKELLQENIV